MEDPATKRRQPRNYLETLEQRVAQLEATLQSVNTPNGSEQLPTRPSEPMQGSSASQTSEDAPQVGDLAARLGMLSVAAGSEPHYLGQSSAVAFTRVINSALLRSIPKMTVPSEANMPPWTASGGDPMAGHCLLPDAEDCIKLSDAYFQHIHAQYPFLHEPTFRFWEMRLMPPESTEVLGLTPASFSSCTWYIPL